jgi:dihydrofolate synthase / folylpolyglutamate synthase
VNTQASEQLQADLKRLFQRTAEGIKPGLDVIRRLDDVLGQPSQACPVIHVAGTNGKGSVCAMLESVLRRAGYRTGLYTSPHLYRFNERIQLNGQPIDDQQVADALRRVEQAERAADTERPATFFELTTVMAFSVFAQEGVDWVILETGMGGRWDATNIVQPVISVVTPIAMDHMEYLGHDLGQIAGEKAGIIKQGRPVVYGDLVPVAEQVVLDEARSRKAQAFAADACVQARVMRHDWRGHRLKLETGERSLAPFTLPLCGRHQVGNCVLAVAALEVLSAQCGVALEDEAIVRGLADMRWPGRFDVLSTEPLTILDVAHNPSGAAVLAGTITELAEGRPTAFVLGYMRDKDIAGCLQMLRRCSRRAWAVPLPGSRAAAADEVALQARNQGFDVETASFSEGMERARAWALAEGGQVCISGSLHLAGLVMERMDAHGGQVWFEPDDTAGGAA